MVASQRRHRRRRDPGAGASRSSRARCSSPARTRSWPPASASSPARRRMTIYKPIKHAGLQGGARRRSSSRRSSRRRRHDGDVNNGKMDVPSILLEPIAVDKANIDADGDQGRLSTSCEDICAGPCRKEQCPQAVSALDAAARARATSPRTFPGVRALDGVSFDLRAGRDPRALRRERRRQEHAHQDALRRLPARAATAARSARRRAACASQALADAETPASRSSPRSWRWSPSCPSPRTSSSAASRARVGPHPTGTRCDATRATAARRCRPRRRPGAPGRRPRHRPAAARRDRARPWPRTPRILILDEPTAALTEAEAARLLALLARAARARRAHASTSRHKLDEVFAIADRITVLRDGAHRRHARRRARRDARGDPRDGRPRGDGALPAPRRARRASRCCAVARLDGRRSAGPGAAWSDGRLASRSARGEVARHRRPDGRRAHRAADARSSALARSRVARHASRSTAAAARRSLARRTRIAAGLALVSEDRKRYGLVLDATSVRDNMTLAIAAPLRPRLFLRRRPRARRAAREAQFGSAAHQGAGARTRRGQLSGGNQQKVVLGKWLLDEAAGPASSTSRRAASTSAPSRRSTSSSPSWRPAGPGRRARVLRAARAAGHEPPRARAEPGRGHRGAHARPKRRRRRS